MDEGCANRARVRWASGLSRRFGRSLETDKCHKRNKWTGWPERVWVVAQ
jgi:hypothetical protein